MAVRNGAATIEGALHSIAQQTFSDWELIVIDGASTDGTLALLEQHHANIATMVSEPDSGIYDAMNKGIAHARGEWLLFLNSDDYLYNADVFNTIFTENDLSTVDFVYGNELIVNPRNGAQMLFSKQFKSFSDLFMGKAMRHQSSLFRRALFTRLGGYDSSFQLVGDREWMARCFNDGSVRINYINTTITVFKRGGASESNPLLRTREKLRVARKYFPPFFVIIHQIRLLLWECYAYIKKGYRRGCD